MCKHSEWQVQITNTGGVNTTCKDGAVEEGEVQQKPEQPNTRALALLSSVPHAAPHRKRGGEA